MNQGYKFGFQGQEEDKETGYVNYKYRMHDPRIGRFFAVDPLAAKYPHNSPYAFSENRVIDGVELEGLEVVLINPKEKIIYQGALQFTDKSAIHVIAHGYEGGIRNRSADLSTKANWIVTKAALEPLLKKSDNYQIQKESGKMCIILHSCNAAKGSNSFAQKVSMEKGRTVVASDSYTRWNSSGQIGTRQNRSTEPNPHVKGSWLIYKEGVLVGAYDADWDADAPPSRWDSFLHEKDITYVTNVSEGSHLNLRSTPETNNQNDIGDISRGTVLDFTGNVDMGWMEVTVNGRTGWVSSNYVEAQYSGKRSKNNVKSTKAK